MIVIIVICMWFLLPAAALADEQGMPPINLPAVTVRSTPFASASLPKLTEPLLNTPQTIIEVPAQQAIDQGAFSMEDALRYVPGVNFHANEDTSQRNQYYVRGFSAENDRYLDGMVEIGDWYMDTFNMERLEVLEGPAGVLFGRGSTGGVVNYVSKVPVLSPLTEIGTSFGTDGTKRATVDFDRVVADATALRINVVGYDGGVADRDRVNFDRLGIAPSISFGLGTGTRLTLSFLHQSEYDLPDYGVPWIDIGSPGAISRPALVPRHNFYGFTDDFARNDVEIGTLNLAHDFNDAVTIRDQFRYGSYTREFRITEPGVSGIIAPGTPLANVTLTRTMQGLQSQETFLDNQTEALLKFDTWGVQHRAVTGLELGRQTSAPHFLTYSNVPTTNLINPASDQPFTATISPGRADSVQALTQAAYVIDTVHFGNDWLLTGAGRLDRFAASVNQINPNFAANETNLVSTWRTALTYKPAQNGSVYFAAGTSFDPSAEALALSATTSILAAERSKTFEFGSKWEFGRLMLSGALFRTTLFNVHEQLPGSSPPVLISAGTARVDGFELIATGDPLERWHFFGGYTYLQTGIIASPNGDLGYRLQNAPKHAAKLWSTYDLTGDLTVGGGIQYVGNRTVQSGPDPLGFLQIVPSYWTVDLMARYRLTEAVALQANIKNLNNAYGYDGIDNNHVVPLAGRSVLFSVTTQF